MKKRFMTLRSLYMDAQIIKGFVANFRLLQSQIIVSRSLQTIDTRFCVTLSYCTISKSLGSIFRHLKSCLQIFVHVYMDRNQVTNFSRKKLSFIFLNLFSIKSITYFNFSRFLYASLRLRSHLHKR